MRGADLLSKLAAAGLTVTANGGAIRIRPRSRLTDELRATIRANKPAILAELASKDAANDANDPRCDPDVERRRTKALTMLADNPGWRFSVVAEAGDQAVIGVAIRDVAYGEIEIPPDRYDGVALLALMERYADETIH